MYCGGTFFVASFLILTCKIITKVLVADAYFDSWQYVPVLIISTVFSCLVNFLASIYMAEKKNIMAMVTALTGAVTNVVLNLILIPRMGANGAAVATACAFVVVFLTRSRDTRRFIKINYQPVVLTCQTVVLVAQTVAALCLQGVWFYGRGTAVCPDVGNELVSGGRAVQTSDDQDAVQTEKAENRGRIREMFRA